MPVVAMAGVRLLRGEQAGRLGRSLLVTGIGALLLGGALGLTAGREEDQAVPGDRARNRMALSARSTPQLSAGPRLVAGDHLRARGDQLGTRAGPDDDLIGQDVAEGQHRDMVV